jgi:hypothetical protein
VNIFVWMVLEIIIIRLENRTMNLEGKQL